MSTGITAEQLTLPAVMVSPHALPPVSEGNGADPELLLAYALADAQAGHSGAGVLCTDYSTDPSDAFQMQQSTGTSTLGVGYGTNGQQIVQIIFDPRTASATRLEFDIASNTPALVLGAGGVGFNGSGPSIPVIPATPTAQDIATALVALGLCTQAA